MKLEGIEKAGDGIHKWVATFIGDTGRKKRVKFGAIGYEDYTIHKDPERRRRYIERHSGMGENWNKPDTAGSLSRYILWEYKNFDRAVREFRKRFHL